MFVVNEDNSIYLTRGDVAAFYVTAKDQNGEPYIFQPGDIVRINIHGRKECDLVVYQKDFPVDVETERVEVFLPEEGTKLGEIISKPKDYWYEITLNPDTNPQTIIGYTEDGATVLKLFPEGGYSNGAIGDTDKPSGGQVAEVVSGARIVNVVLYGDKWLGTESPYSQVVYVEGATKNSQVDLTPSAAQLSIFHNKDLAFVTENTDGVVTVYAIGQKPERDYTMQATVREVQA